MSGPRANDLPHYRGLHGGIKAREIGEVVGAGTDIDIDIDMDINIVIAMRGIQHQIPCLPEFFDREACLGGHHV